MKIPVSWALTATLDIGIVWYNSADADVQENAYAPFGQPNTVLPSFKRVNLTGFHLVSDAADAELTIGVYNVTTDAYTAKYTVNATGIANGGVVAGGPLDPAMAALDLYDPANPTHIIVPAVQLITAVIANISGDLQFQVPPLTADELGAVLMVAQLNQQEEDSTVQLEENDTNQLEERQT